MTERIRACPKCTHRSVRVNDDDTLVGHIDPKTYEPCDGKLKLGKWGAVRNPEQEEAFKRFLKAKKKDA